MNLRTRLLFIPFVAMTSLACGLFGGEARPPGTVTEFAADESPSPDSFSLVVVRPSQGDLAALLAAHAQRAAEIERRPFVEFSAEWCLPCKRLAESLSDDRMVEAFRGVYLIRLDIDEWKSRMSGTDFIVIGVPTFFELNDEGQSTGRTITGAAWGADVPENMAPVLQGFFRGASQAP
jgi:thiol:disulfide interchange protein